MGFELQERNKGINIAQNSHQSATQQLGDKLIRPVESLS